MDKHQGLENFTIGLAKGGGQVSGLLSKGAAQCPWTLVLGHGAGSDMNHEFLADFCSRLGARKLGSLRYQFPYREQGRKMPDRAPVLCNAVRSAVGAAAEALPGVRLLAGGKSMGGRMSSLAQSEQPLPRVEGLVFLGFPLHPPKKPGVSRAEHLSQVQLPMLFLQGTRDLLADRELIEGVCQNLGSRATLHFVEGADHGFQVLKRSGRTQEEVRAELIETVASWVGKL